MINILKYNQIFFSFNKLWTTTPTLSVTQLIKLTLSVIHLFIYLFGVLHRFQYCTGHITMGSWKGRGNQYIEFVRVLYCKLPTNSKQLPAFPLEAIPGIEPRSQRWEARVFPLCHRGPISVIQSPALLIRSMYTYSYFLNYNGRKCPINTN